MKKVSNLLTKEEFNSKIKEKLKNEISNNIYKINKDKISGTQKFLTSIKFIIIISFLIFLSFVFLFLNFINNNKKNYNYFILFGLFLFLSIISLFLYFNNKKNILKIYRENFDQKKLWKMSFNNLKDIELLNVFDGTIPELITDRRKIITYPYTILNKSKIFRLKIKDKYYVEIQTAYFRYRNWKKTTLNTLLRSQVNNSFLRIASYQNDYSYENSGVIKIDLNNIHLNHNFNFGAWKEKDDNLSEIKLENRKFNKNFYIYSNDKVKIRMIFTPLTMEKILNLKNNMVINNFILKKQNQNIIITFENLKDQLQFNGFYHPNINKTINQFYNDILNDVYFTYQLIGMVLIPPFL